MQGGSEKYQTLSQRDESILRGPGPSSSSGRPVLDEVVNPLHSDTRGSGPSAATASPSALSERPPHVPMKTQTGSGVQAEVATGGIAASSSGGGVGYQKLEEDTDELL